MADDADVADVSHKRARVEDVKPKTTKMELLHPCGCLVERDIVSQRDTVSHRCEWHKRKPETLDQFLEANNELQRARQKREETEERLNAMMKQAVKSCICHDGSAVMGVLGHNCRNRGMWTVYCDDHDIERRECDLRYEWAELLVRKSGKKLKEECKRIISEKQT